MQRFISVNAFLDGLDRLRKSDLVVKKLYSVLRM